MDILKCFTSGRYEGLPAFEFLNAKIYKAVLDGRIGTLSLFTWSIYYLFFFINLGRSPGLIELWLTILSEDFVGRP